MMESNSKLSMATLGLDNMKSKTKVGFGKGFINNNKLPKSDAKVYPVDPKNGMPIVKKKK